MHLSNADKNRFRTIGHKLNPVVIIAQKGLTENIRKEIERALTKQEVIKIKLITCSREDKKAMTEFICGKFGAQCIQSIGHMILLYRTSQKAKPRSS
jgi:RNA-binding protein